MKIGTIFSYQVNEDDRAADGLIDADLFGTCKGALNQYSRDHLESYIGDYNEMFATNYSTEEMYKTSKENFKLEQFHSQSMLILY